jgi:4,5-DOPA dioxygenase extradiol
MNAIEENEFVNGFRKVPEHYPQPLAVVCISAHWETPDIRITSSPKPPTIHDFSGFPEELYQLSYPAPGNPLLAKEIATLSETYKIIPDAQRGLDHGCWSVLKHLYPDADIPVLQLSLSTQLSTKEHYLFAKDLFSLRNKGVLFVGSGNIVHNLSRIAWGRLDETYGYDWALEADSIIKKLVVAQDHEALINYHELGSAVNSAIPTPEHFLPLIYILGLSTKNESICIFNSKPVGGSLTMTSFMML